MFIFIQPFGVAAQNGGARIIRSLIQTAPMPCRAICTALEGQAMQSFVLETSIPSRLPLTRLDRTRLRGYLDMFLGAACEPLFTRLITRYLKASKASHVHMTAHGDDFWPIYRACRDLGIPTTVAIHDDFTPYLKPMSRRKSAYRKLGIVWTEADRRIVISRAMGDFYESLFGRRSCDVITDSLESIAHGPRGSSGPARKIYFMGSMHLSYRENFSVLCSGLGLLATESGKRQRLVVRGAPPDVSCNGVETEIRAWSGEADVASDMQSADLLYLPLPFDSAYENFVRYSFSTKLISYLGSGVPILYHGPKNSAVAHCLERNDAALFAFDARAETIARVLAETSAERLVTVASNALSLARRDFTSSVVKDRFWSFYTDRK